MGKSTKPKRNGAQSRQEPPYSAPTPERVVRDHFAPFALQKASGERADARQETTPRVQSRVLRWHRDRWIGDDGLAALVDYETTFAACRYDHARSCLDMTPVGNERGDTARAVADSRSRLASMRNAVADRLALMFVHEMLFDTDGADQVAARLLPAGMSRDVAQDRKRGMVAAVADALAGWQEARRMARAA